MKNKLQKYAELTVKLGANVQEGQYVMIFSSIENPSAAEKRTARKRRRASSLKRRSGSPTQRMIFLSKSSTPPNGSTRPISSL